MQALGTIATRPMRTVARDARSLRPYRVWPFSGGHRGLRWLQLHLRAQAARNGSYANYRDTARQRDVPCPHGGYRNVRADVLDDAFAALLSRPLPQTWRADIAALRAKRAADTDGGPSTRGGRGSSPSASG
jgi:hypothetical protein